MGETELLRQMLRIAVRESQAGSARAETALAWCRENSEFLGLPNLSGEGGTGKKKKKKARKRAEGAKAPWDRLRRAVAAWDGVQPDPAPVAEIATASRLSSLLALAPADARLLTVAIALNRLRRPASLAARLRGTGMCQMRLAAELAGLDSADNVPQSAVVRLGLAEIRSWRGGEVTLDLTDATWRALRRAPAGDEALIESLAGPRNPARLTPADFAERGAELTLMLHLLEGALKARAAGINILLYGPPGSGKTELAKVVAETAGARLFAVGEADEDGDEPSRWDRLTALKLAQRVLANRGDSVLLFDEMEDFIGEVQRAGRGGFFTRRDGSKVFVNRLFEANPVPTIWTSNTIENVDPALLRRMSYVLKMDLPGPAARQRIVGAIAASEGLALPDAAAGRLSALAPEAMSVARSALRTATLAGGGDDQAEAIAEALIGAMRHGRRLHRARAAGEALDLDLYQSEPAPADLLARLSAPGAPADFSLLMTGPPGTGKTALAHHLAGTLDRPLVVKRASDLMSKWVGETEKLIADAFAEAAGQGHVLLFDEVDSLLFDRATAERSWEVSQVNELLTWMDGHPQPFIAATNHAGRLDPAAMRRFDFKLALEPLPPAKAAKAYAHFFNHAAPAGLAGIEGLTPGDFAVVARQLRFQGAAPAPAEILARLEAELRAKPHRPRRIGFRARA